VKNRNEIASLIYLYSNQVDATRSHNTRWKVRQRHLGQVIMAASPPRLARTHRAYPSVAILNTIIYPTLRVVNEIDYLLSNRLPSERCL
jgi:hypothetical protein